MVLLASITSIALAETVVHVKVASLDDVQGDCLEQGGMATYWHFVINGISEETAPASIHVYWDNSHEADVPLLKVSGKVAHYETYDNAGALVEDATAVVPDEWKGQFNLSHVTCEFPQEELTVTKTVVTAYTRTHDWSIEKSVDTENGYEHEGYPKVWLYVDGHGDETATWTVDVTYEGYEDSGFNVSGDITIENTGEIDAIINSVIDELAGTPITVDCGVYFPYVLDAGATLVCTYNEDVLEKVVGDNVATVTTEVDTYSDTKPIVWGEPTTEVNAIVDVMDHSDLNGDVLLDTLYAADYEPGDIIPLEYSNAFHWEDYGGDLCGDYTYNNMAEVIGDEDVVLDSDDATLKVNVQCYVYETAFAMGDPAICFLDDGFSRWGWTNPVNDGQSIMMPLYAGAAQCDTSKGTRVGSVLVVFEDYEVTVIYDVWWPYLLDETHVYAGRYKYPYDNGNWTVAPGQYYIEDLHGQSIIYVIAHAVVGIPDPDFGP